MSTFGPGKYTRGWETAGHYWALFRSSVKTHLVISLVLGLVLGGAWFWSGLSTDDRSLLPGHLKDTSGFGSLSATIKTLSGKGEAGSGGDFQATLEGSQPESLGGRSIFFLSKQLVFRIAFVFFLVLIFFGLVVAKRGRRISEEEHVRGIKVVDAKAQAKERFRARIRRMVALAIALGSLVFCISLGQKGRANFSPYIWSATYLSVPFVAGLAGQDDLPEYAWYHLHHASDADSAAVEDAGFFKSQEVYDYLKAGSFSDKSLAALVKKWFLLVVLCGGLMVLAYIFWFAAREKKTQNTRLSLAQVPIEPGSESSHFLITGSPGSGKSTAIKELLDQVRARGERAIVYDPSGEYIEPYYREGRDVILNPMDQRSAIWTPWADARNSSDYYSIARSLFPLGGRDPFWNEAGAALFAAAAQKLSEQGKPTIFELNRLLTTGSIKELAQFLRDTPASKFLDSDAGHMPANLIATVTSKLSSLALLSDPKPGRKPFSIRKFVGQEQDSWMFLAMRQDQQAAMKPLVSLWCDLASNSILSLPPDQNRRLWVILDEVASLQRLPALPPLLAQGRKHGAAVVLGLQSMPQLRDCYGRDAAAALASQPQTWLAFRIVEPDTALWVEHALGEAEVDETRESVSMGAESYRDGVSLQKSTRKKPAAMSTELMTLPDLHAYLKLSGKSHVYRVNFDWRERLAIAHIFVPKRGLRRS